MKKDKFRGDKEAVIAEINKRARPIVSTPSPPASSPTLTHIHARPGPSTAKSAPKAARLHDRTHHRPPDPHTTAALRRHERRARAGMRGGPLRARRRNVPHAHLARAPGRDRRAADRARARDAGERRERALVPRRGRARAGGEGRRVGGGAPGEGRAGHRAAQDVPERAARARGRPHLDRGGRPWGESGRFRVFSLFLLFSSLALPCRAMRVRRRRDAPLTLTLTLTRAVGYRASNSTGSPPRRLGCSSPGCSITGTCVGGAAPRLLRSLLPETLRHLDGRGR